MPRARWTAPRSSRGNETAPRVPAQSTGRRSGTRRRCPTCRSRSDHAARGWTARNRPSHVRPAAGPWPACPGRTPRPEVAATAALARQRVRSEVHAEVTELAAPRARTDIGLTARKICSYARADRQDAEVALAGGDVAVASRGDVVEQQQARRGPAGPARTLQVEGGVAAAEQGRCGQDHAIGIDRPRVGESDGVWFVATSTSAPSSDNTANTLW